MSENLKKPRRKLPPRYPRDQEIIIFGDMAELDHVLEGLKELEKALLVLPETISHEAWIDFTKNSVLYGIAKFLRKAYIEFERFYQREGWCYEADNNLQNDFLYASDFLWRLRELRHGRLVEFPASIHVSSSGTFERPAHTSYLYEPAQLTCAEALFLAMLMMESACSDDYIKSFMADLRYYLTRYHATSLEVVAGRNAAFLPGKRIGAKSNIHKYLDALYEAQTDRVDRKAFEKIIDAECSNRTVNKFRMLTFYKTQDRTLYYTDGHQSKSIKIATILNRHGFPKGKKPKSKN